MLDDQHRSSQHQLLVMRNNRKFTEKEASWWHEIRFPVPVWLARGPKSWGSITEGGGTTISGPFFGGREKSSIPD